ncbi:MULTISPECIES: hypothetical protein [unclassified Leifsonia]|uniref:hypothetical protein n=1 Tax=unclassified Leifsonia TaxID=2663824 RepID=UPI0006F95601|nr:MULTISPECIES: hypothetical protein [unclassified Leifsonia]KQX05653.1 hypothetical protein ASC59_16405 [Leifsonia sp. Root1293]KRA09289.1 hypothetical protein ASD61_16400 [Leifsonia sp. Root60]
MSGFGTTGLSWDGIRSRIEATRTASWRESPQVVDPLGTLSAHPLAWIGSVMAVSYAGFQTARQWDAVQHPAVGIAAVVVLVVACAVFLVAAHPTSSPFGPQAAFIVVALAVMAAALETLSRFGANLLLQDDFGQVTVAILLAMMAPYRPALSLVTGAVASSVALALFPVIQAPYFAVHAPLAEYIVVLVVPPLALGLAAAAFSNGFVRAVRNWQRLVSRAALEIEDEARIGLARSVQQQQVSVLARDVLPFLTRGINAQTVEPEDVDRARQLADVLRGTLVAEIGRTWLDDVADGIALPDGRSPAVDDPDLLALRMSGEQRVACAALVAAISADLEIAATSVSVVLRPNTLARRRVGASSAAASVTVRISATTDAAPRALGAREAERLLVQYLAVVRVLFEGVVVRVSAGTVTVGFDYAQH